MIAFLVPCVRTQHSKHLLALHAGGASDTIFNLEYQNYKSSSAATLLPPSQLLLSTSLSSRTDLHFLWRTTRK
jgi:hypothetical protein